MAENIRVRRTPEDETELVSDLYPFPVAVMESVGLIRPKRTCRVSFSLAAVSGDAVELRGVRGMRITLTEMGITKPTAAETVILVRRLGQDTGGTSTAPTIFLSDPDDDGPGASVFLYTVAPTLATSGGNALQVVVGTTDTLIVDFTKTAGVKAPMLTGAQSLAINVDATATVVGWLEWTEESL